MNLLRAAVALPVCALLAVPASAGDWPEPGGGSRNSNSTASFEAPRSAPVEKWRAKYDDVLGEPVVSEGVVYAAVRRVW